MKTRPALVLILSVSALAIALLFWLIYGVETASAGESRWAFLPASNAFFNAVSATAVIIGLWHIRNQRKRAHGICMLTAFAASSLFLVGYIIHHTLHGDTRFLTEGWIRPLYFFILISHIILSIAVLPLVLTTFYFAAVRHWSAHRALARWTYPVWLYVSVTGVLVFVFLRFLNAA
jgi:putative membrane protein